MVTEMGTTVDTVTDTNSFMGNESYPMMHFSQELANKIELWFNVTTGFYVPILVFGLFGNGMSLALLLPEMKKSSTYCYLFALSIFDSIYLLASAVPWIVLSISKGLIDIRIYLECNLLFIANVVLKICSAWTLVIVSVERLIIVYNPSLGKEISKNIVRARCVIVGMVVIALGANWDYFGGYLTNRSGGNQYQDNVCPAREAIEYYAEIIKPWLSAVWYSYLPSLILCVTNCAIILKFRQAQKQVAVSNITGASTIASQTMAKKSKRITILGIVLSTTFLVLTIPRAGVSIYFNANSSRLARDPITYYNYMILYQVVSALALLNHAINFALYFATSEKFRARFSGFVLCRTPNVDNSSQNTS